MKLKLLLAGAFWILYLGLDVVKKSIWDRGEDYVLYYYIPGILVWLLLTIPFVKISEWSGQFRTGSNLLILIISGFVVGSLKTILTFSIQFSIDPTIQVDFMGFLVSSRPFYYVESTIVAWVMVGYLLTFDIYRKYLSKLKLAAELEAQLSKSHLETLRRQFEPHFLFNTLNTVAALVRSKRNSDAIEVINGFSGLLRTILDEKKTQFVTLEEEIEFVRQYLEIESVRFKDRLTVIYDIDPSAKEVMVPNLILQPIVENAVKHGISKYIGSSEIIINAACFDDQLIIVIKNTDPRSTDMENNIGYGIGLKNVEERLDKLFNSNAKIEIRLEESMTIATLKIPIHHETV
ncbi:MAG: histidine kinase [Cyclobacteriaceae bacterium]